MKRYSIRNIAARFFLLMLSVGALADEITLETYDDLVKYKLAKWKTRNPDTLHLHLYVQQGWSNVQRLQEYHWQFFYAGDQYTVTYGSQAYLFLSNYLHHSMVQASGQAQAHSQLAQMHAHLASFTQEVSQQAPGSGVIPIFSPGSSNQGNQPQGLVPANISPAPVDSEETEAGSFDQNPADTEGEGTAQQAGAGSQAQDAGVTATQDNQQTIQDADESSPERSTEPTTTSETSGGNIAAGEINGSGTQSPLVTLESSTPSPQSPLAAALSQSDSDISIPNAGLESPVSSQEGSSQPIAHSQEYSSSLPHSQLSAPPESSVTTPSVDTESPGLSQGSTSHSTLPSSGSGQQHDPDEQEEPEKPGDSNTEKKKSKSQKKRERKAKREQSKPPGSTAKPRKTSEPGFTIEVVTQPSESAATSEAEKEKEEAQKTSPQTAPSVGAVAAGVAKAVLSGSGGRATGGGGRPRAGSRLPEASAHLIAKGAKKAIGSGAGKRAAKKLAKEAVKAVQKVTPPLSGQGANLAVKGVKETIGSGAGEGAAKGLVKEVVEAVKDATSSLPQASSRSGPFSSTILNVGVPLAVGAMAVVAGVVWYFYGGSDPASTDEESEQQKPDNVIPPLDPGRWKTRCDPPLREPYASVCQRYLSNDKFWEAALLEQFARSDWRQNNYHAMGVLAGDTLVITSMEQFRKSVNISPLRYARIGYLATDETDQRMPGYLSTGEAEFLTTLELIIRQLTGIIPASGLLELHDQSIPLVHTVLQWCGMPVGKAATRLYSACVKQVTGLLKDSHGNWLREELNMFYSSQFHFRTGVPGERYLGVLPYFPITSATALGLPDYEMTEMQFDHRGRLAVVRVVIQDQSSDSQEKVAIDAGGQNSVDAYMGHGEWASVLVSNDADGRLLLEPEPGYIYRTSGQSADPNTPQYFGYHGRRVIYSMLAEPEPPSSHAGRHQSTTQSPRFHRPVETEVLPAPEHFCREQPETISAQGPRPTDERHDVVFPESLWQEWFSIKTPAVNRKQDHNIRSSGLTPLLQHYLSNGQNENAHMLFSFMHEHDMPFGLLIMKEVGAGVSQSEAYQPLSGLAFEEQKKQFDRAMKLCKKNFKEPCQYQNLLQKEVVRFSLLVCQSITRELCLELIQQKHTRVYYFSFLSMLDWPEDRPSSLLDNNTPGYFVSCLRRATTVQLTGLAVSIWERSKRDLRAEFSPLDQYFEVDGEYRCERLGQGRYERHDCTVVDGKTYLKGYANGGLWLVSTGDDQLVHNLLIQDGVLQKPWWNREAYWQKTHVREVSRQHVDSVQERSELIRVFGVDALANLEINNCQELSTETVRNFCLGMKGNEVSLLKLALFEKALISQRRLPVYQGTVLADASLLYQPESFSSVEALTFERLQIHFRLMKMFPLLSQNDPLGIKVLAFLGSVVSLPGNYDLNDTYEAFYRVLENSAQSGDKLMEQKLTRCFFIGAAEGVWCRETPCVVVMPSFRLKGGRVRMINTPHLYDGDSMMDIGEKRIVPKRDVLFPLRKMKFSLMSYQGSGWRVDAPELFSTGEGDYAVNNDADNIVMAIFARDRQQFESIVLVRDETIYHWQCPVIVQD